jgi:AraC family transcriptional regulator
MVDPSSQEIVLNQGTGERRPLTKGVVESSRALKWPNLRAERHRVKGFSIEGIFQNHVLMIPMSQAVTVEMELKGRRNKLDIARGQVMIHPSDSHISMYSSDTLDFLTISLTPRLMTQVCTEYLKSASVIIQPTCATGDSFLKAACMQIYEQMKGRQPCGKMYAEVIAKTLGLHLAMFHANGITEEHSTSGGLAPFQLKRALAYVHAHLGSNGLSVAKMADAAGLSLFYFIRQFKINMRISPRQYIIRQRLELSKTLLIQNKLALDEITQKVGFQNKSTFIHRFRRVCGVTPFQFRRRILE